MEPNDMGQEYPVFTKISRVEISRALHNPVAVRSFLPFISVHKEEFQLRPVRNLNAPAVNSTSAFSPIDVFPIQRQRKSTRASGHFAFLPLPAAGRMRA